MPNAIETPASTATLSPFVLAFERVLPEMQALPEESLAVINLDIPTAVTTALGALPEIMAHRERAAALPGFDLSSFDALATYTYALGHAHAIFLGTASASSSLQALGEAAAESRELLLSDAEALARRGLLEPERLQELKGPPGYRNIAFDLLALATILRESWSAIEGKTALRQDELSAAEVLAEQLIRAVGVREQAPHVIATSSEMRQRAFTLFVRAYDQARRAVRFLRWDDGDHDAIAPSLYAGRSNGRRRGEGAEETTLAPASTAPALSTTAAGNGANGSTTVTPAR